ncbi:helix-turn-helix domain-containing protein [Aeribacillus pallidus]|nr:helix-turn-helix domain-containing protein [Aeribacillus pallidus]
MDVDLNKIIRSLIIEEIAKVERRLRKELQVGTDQDLSFSEACEYLHMSEYTLRQLIRQKRIPHRIYGSPGSKNPRYVFSRSRLDQWKREEEEKNYLGAKGGEYF